ncbi:replication initiation protein [Sporolituus thermophilus]|uniref:Initiator Replication protein n=1 Tax=Sporolituus thermophilus DSM 23256 TaxID=1123285 RepID=A0A1G7MGY5_9FIRM|nr:replication initiation protein [Sporolituus thermophilus]SDF61128.1 Initiator Replication protein [Sporolituus thermophilus DSM 23256]
MLKNLYMPNAMIEAGWCFSELEHHILFHVFAQVNEKSQVIMLQAKDIFDEIDDWKYKEIKKATARLISRVIIVEEDGKTIQIPLFQKVEYSAGKIYIQLDKYISEMFRAIKAGRYTKIPLEEIGKIKGKYAHRIYMLAKQYEKKKNREIAIDKLCFALNISVSDKEYKTIKRDCLVPAYNEINKKTNVELNVKEVKNGKKVEKIILEINSKEKTDPRYNELLMYFSESELNELVEKYGIEYCYAKYLGLKKEKNVKNIKNEGAWLKQAIVNNWKTRYEVESENKDRREKENAEREAVALAAAEVAATTTKEKIELSDSQILEIREKIMINPDSFAARRLAATTIEQIRSSPILMTLIEEYFNTPS